MPNGQLPVLELQDGTKLAESEAIIRYLGMQHGYYPKDPMEAYRCDEMLETVRDVVGNIYKPFFINDPAAKEEKCVEIFTSLLPKWLNLIDPYLAKGQFIAGPKLSSADFFVGGIYCNFFTNKACPFGGDRWNELLTKFPNFKAYGERFAAANATRLKNRPAHPI